MTDSKKLWVEPELIVLVRNKPEEAVLVVCKKSAGSGDPALFNDSCDTECNVWCSDQAGS